MTQLPNLLLESLISEPTGRDGAKRTRGPESDCAGAYEALNQPVRHWLGDRPTNFLNARLNAASDS